MDSTPSVVRDIPFATHRHSRLVGDLYLPSPTASARVALVIHGGGWSTSDKTSLAPISLLLAQRGIANFSINYRRLTEAPWPACYEDCVSGFHFLRDPAFLSQHGLRASFLMVVGASAGAHLALMTALSRPADQVSHILAIAPPAQFELHGECCFPDLFSPEFYSRFFGQPQLPSAQQLADISPLSLVNATSPPLWIAQNVHDKLVIPRHADKLERAYRLHHRAVQRHDFDGPDTLHGLWIDNNAPRRVLTAPAQIAIETSIDEMLSLPS